MASLLRPTAVFMSGRDRRNSAADVEEKCIQTVVGNPEGQRRPGRPRTRQNTLKTGLQHLRG